MTSDQDFDIVVIGGGPAGSIASTVLARHGHSVVVIEKQRHPRYAVGESLIPDFWKYCDLVGVSEKIKAEGFIQKAGGTVAWKDQVRSHTFKDFGYGQPALHIERDRFDQILIEHAAEEGVDVRQETAVTRVDFADPDRPVVHCRPSGAKSSQTLRCRYVIDASGQNSIIGRQLGLRKIDESFRYMSIWGYFENSRYIAFGGRAHPPEDLPNVPPTTFVTSLDETAKSGWGWHIALRHSTSVGLVLPRQLLKDIKKPDEDWQDFFLRRCYEVPVWASLLAEARFVPDSVRLIRDYSYRSSQLAGPGYYLVGDAAGFIDPIFSVGVVLAMYSAYAAAWAINRSLGKPGLAEDSRELFTRQVQGRIEVARSLALPNYTGGGEISDLAKEAIRLERAPVQDLMQVVSTLTSRSDNYKDMTDQAVRELGANQLYIIDELELD
jgi:flavin-dependent dehydrogenase